MEVTMIYFAAGLVVGWALASLQGLCDEYETATGRFPALRTVLGDSFFRFLWRRISVPFRVGLRKLRNVIQNRRCARCNRILPGDDCSEYLGGQCAACRFDQLRM